MKSLKWKKHFPLILALWIVFPLFSELPLWATCTFLFITMATFIRDELRVNLLPPFFKHILTVGSLAATLFYFKTLKGYEPAINFLALITALKVFESKNLRDYKILLYFMIFLVMGNALFFQTATLSLHILISLFLIFTLFLEQSKGLGLRYEYFGSLKTLLKLFLYTAPFIALIFLIFPRYGGIFGGPQLNTTKNLIGFSDELDPAKIQELLQNDTLVFRVEFPEGQNVLPKDLYWRGLILSATNGQTWKAITQNFQTSRSEFLIENETQKNKNTIKQTFILEPSYKDFLFALDLPLEISNFSHPSFSSKKLKAQTFKATRPIAIRLKYDVISQFNSYPFYELSDEEKSEYLNFPKKLNQSKGQELISSLKDSDENKTIQNVLNYFTTHLSYTLTPGSFEGTRKNYFIDWFLFENKKGFCAHFASSFALLMRMAGIPSRVVIGYQGGEMNQYGNYIIVRENNAHAWTEVFLNKKGWIKIDPTYNVAPERIDRGEDPARLFKKNSNSAFFKFYYNVQLFLDGVGFKWNQFLLNYDLEYQKEFFQKFFHTKFIWSEALGWAFMLSSLFMFLSAFTYGKRFFYSYKKSPQEKLADIYKQLMSRLEKKSCPRYPYESPLAFLKRLENENPLLAVKLKPILETYCFLRYEKKELTTNDVKSFKILSLIN